MDDMNRLSRIDPPDCSCTDCITGYSKPIDQASPDEVDRLMNGELDDASSMPWDEVNERIAEYARQARQHAIQMFAQMCMRD